MKILYINHTNTISGAGISFSILLRNLGPGVEKYFLLHRKSGLAGRFGAEPEKTYRDPFVSLSMTTLYGEGMPVHLRVFHALKAPLAWPTLAYLKSRWKPDLVHLNETVLAHYAVAASLLGMPLVIHARTVVDPARVGMKMLRWVAQRGRCRFVSIDRETHDSLPWECRAVGEVIYNPVDLPEAGAEAVLAKRKAWGLPENAFVVGQLASLHKEKGIWRILDIARTLCPRYRDLHFVLAGDRDAAMGEGPALAEAIGQAGLQDRVHLVGYETDLPAAYGALDVALCLFGEYLRGVGRAAYEAPLAGKPLIATLPNPDSSDSVIQGVTGLGFECEDYEGVASAICELIENRGKGIDFGRRAKETLADRHSPMLHAERVRTVYQELLGQAVLRTRGNP